jgi:predicted urease superfamily metal-dependent hydrolase
MKNQLSAPNISEPRYAFTRIEAARVLGVSPATIDRLTKRGLLHPIRAIYRPLYSSEELQRFCRETTGGIE